MDDQFVGLRIPTLELIASCTVISYEYVLR